MSDIRSDHPSQVTLGSDSGKNPFEMSLELNDDSGRIRVARLTTRRREQLIGRGRGCGRGPDHRRRQRP